MADNNIEGRFHHEMIRIYEKAKRECGYNATRFLQIVTELGGRQAAKSLLRANTLSDGLTELWKLGRLDLSMEALILRSPWNSLFTDEELATAANRLQDLGYVPGGQAN